MDLLKENLLPWVNASFAGGYVFTQDGAPSHSSKATQQWCKIHLKRFRGKDMLSPSSPNVNPMDFAIWSILERDVCATPHSSTADLKLVLETAWANLSEDVMRRSRLSLKARLEAMVKAK